MRDKYADHFPTRMPPNDKSSHSKLALCIMNLASSNRKCYHTHTLSLSLSSRFLFLVRSIRQLQKVEKHSTKIRLFLFLFLDQHLYHLFLQDVEGFIFFPQHLLSCPILKSIYFTGTAGRGNVKSCAARTLLLRFSVFCCLSFSSPMAVSCLFFQDIKSPRRHCIHFIAELGSTFFSSLTVTFSNRLVNIHGIGSRNQFLEIFK